MIILNFAYPITDVQRAQIEEITGLPVGEIRDIAVQFNVEAPFHAQVAQLFQAAKLEPQQWQTEELLINPPSHNMIAILVVTEFHARSGHFPAVLRLKPRQGPLPGYDVAEVINLSNLRDAARSRRLDEE